MNAADLYQSPNALASHYSAFDVGNRVLLTGHSHQAWPDCGFEGQQQAWRDAATYVDDKWDRAFARADRVRRGYATLLGDATERIALGPNTHELVVRWLSALPLRVRPRLVTTDGEFHTVRRQLDRLSEEGIEIVKVPHRPVADLAQRTVDAIDRRTAAVMISAVLFENGRIVPGLDVLGNACQAAGLPLLVDAYHALNVVPFSLRQLRLEEAYVVGGGYKYCQLGEGNCFLRFPESCAMRPVITGWFSEFAALAPGPPDAQVQYGEGHARFAGATYDPTSHYRAAEVLDFFERQRLTAALLREVSRHQIGLLADLVDQLDADPEVISRERSVDLAGIGGFLALRTPCAGDLVRLLRERGVHSDHRGAVLRLGPAPYLSDRQLRTGVEALGDAIASWKATTGASR